MEKSTDLYNDLEIDLNVFSDYPIKKQIILNKVGDINTIDIFKNKKDINLSGNTKIKSLKSKGKNIDSIIKSKKNKSIYLVKKNKIKFFFKYLLYKLNFGNNSNSINLKFEKNKKLKKNNIIKNKAKSKNKNSKFIKNFLKKFKTTKFSKKKIFGKKVLFRKSFFKYLISTFIFIFLFYLIDGIAVQYYLKSGYNNLLQTINNNNDLTLIKNNINKAKSDFYISDILFKPFLIIPNEDIKNVYYINKGGKSLSLLFYEGYNYYTKINNNFLNQKVEDIYFTELFSDSKDEFIKFENLLYDVILNYNNVGNIYVNEFDNDFEYAKNELQFVYNLLLTLNRNFDVFLDIFGDKEEKTYLILFQNNDEIRPTGGFIGSIGKITLFKGKIKDFEKSDIYALEWELDKVIQNKIKSPEGINLVSEYFSIRDANNKISFIDSSKQIKFFADKIIPDIDGIIYMNQNIILDFLELTGDIYFEKIGENINKDNFSQLISTLVEAKTFKVGTLSSPKGILFDFINVFVEKLKDEKLYSKYLKIIYDNVIKREIVINSFNNVENSLLWKFSLTGDIDFSNSFDYNYPIFMSLGGGKTDRYMDRNFTKTINKNSDCSINTSINISQTHMFTQEEEDKQLSLMKKYDIIDESILFIQGKADNIQFIQILLPKDAIIKNDDFLTIKEYNNSKLVQFYTTTRRLESINHTIEYILINPECKEYDYTFYKQSGISNYDLIIKDSNKKVEKKGINEDFYYK